MLLRHLALAVTDEHCSCGRTSGVEIVEEPSYVSVKCRDPDGYVVEAYWEPG